MRPIAVLAVLATLAGADVAAAAGARPVHHRTASQHSFRMHGASPSHRRRLRQHPPTTIGLQTQTRALGRSYRASNDDDGLPNQPGFFRSEREREAGLGFKDGSTQTVLGVYQRPPDPNIPGPRIYSKPEGRGAAGLSLSFKLGQ